MAKTFYEILGLPADSPFPAIKAAYKKLALQLHPDKNKSKNTTEQFQELSGAWEVLQDKKKRATYDADLRNGPTRHNGTSPPSQEEVWDEHRAFAQKAQSERARYRQKKTERDQKSQQQCWDEQRKKAERDWQEHNSKQSNKSCTEDLGKETTDGEDQTPGKDAYDWEKHEVIERKILEGLAEYYSADMPHLKRAGILCLFERIYQAYMAEGVEAAKKAATAKEAREAYEKAAAAEREAREAYDKAAAAEKEAKGEVAARRFFARRQAGLGGYKTPFSKILKAKPTKESAESKSKSTPTPNRPTHPPTSGKYRADDSTFIASLKADYDKLEKDISAIEDIIRMLGEDFEYCTWASMELMHFLARKGSVRLDFDLQLQAEQRISTWKKVMSETLRGLEEKLEVIRDELNHFKE